MKIYLMCQMPLVLPWTQPVQSLVRMFLQRCLLRVPPPPVKKMQLNMAFRPGYIACYLVLDFHLHSSAGR